MTNMLVFQCYEKNETGSLWSRCNWNVLFKEWDDPTTSSGCCPCCGGRNWEIWETNVSEAEYFKRILQDNGKAIVYVKMNRIS